MFIPVMNPETPGEVRCRPMVCNTRAVRYRAPTSTLPLAQSPRCALSQLLGWITARTPVAIR